MPGAHSNCEVIVFCSNANVLKTLSAQARLVMENDFKFTKKRRKNKQLSIMLDYWMCLFYQNTF